MTKVTKIDHDDLKQVAETRAKAVTLAKSAEEAIKDARIAEMEFKVTIQQLYLEKGLNANCRVDLGTGVVTWPEEEAEPTSEPKRKRTTKKKAEQDEDTTVDTDGSTA